MRIGVDLGGTKIEIIALDDEGSELLRRRISTPANNYESTIGAIADLVRDAERATGRTGTIGIGTPGSVSPRSGRIRNSNSTVLIGRDFQTDIARTIGRPVRIANDANCFVLSEATDGAASGDGVVFGVILGTGVGGAIAVRGSVPAGKNGIAGEWGHVALPWPRDDERPGRACYCGKFGCIETFLSGPNLARQFRERAGRELGAREIHDAAVAGDAAAQGCLAEYEDRLARGLAMVVNIVDPDTIVMGGGVSNMQRLYSNLPSLLQRYVFSDALKTKVVRAHHGDSSGVRGAAMLWQQAER